MSASTAETTVQQRRPDEPLARFVEWFVTGMLVLGGLAVAAIGLAVYGGADRAWIAQLVAEGRIESTELTNAELIDVTYALAWWLGIGLLVTGLLLVLGGIGFLAYRRRARARHAEHHEADSIASPDTLTNAVAGGIVTVLTSFVPFSPVVGGLVSGYLQATDRTDGIRVGAYAGLVVAAPLVLLFLFLVGAAAVVATELSLAVPALVGIAGLTVGLLVAVAYLVALSALGGYLGVAVSERTTDADAGL
ncbi:DUF5518 domain-containing protein [Halapricum hydrolyticum]|uniref:DUF5518 domain-containing protein n=1 Tax=Halapricum hydrolyticum TaxID=2979991 RepID=A0AAE3IE67_9EURY|nr:DUF5518 domain-containing protein [Halapricum hydrolyticum]MCU4718686.1 DUF5518 domain-containing protein [Halapricum hydrolyticum]MCU4727628.1 DUF5518 domain-containing protein [Halapricum hydrolyticum]